MLRRVFALALVVVVTSGCRRPVAGAATGPAILTDPAANFFGLESRGAGQARSDGTLALTATELWFGRTSAGSGLTIPVAEIHAVDLAASHLGKTSGRQLVRVRFGAGPGDTAAWAVDDAVAWVREIQRARAAR
jgi:hypothetical protein